MTESAQAPSPEAVRALLAAPMPGGDETVGEHLTGYLAARWESLTIGILPAPVLRRWAVILAAVRAGLVNGKITRDGALASVDIEAADALVLAAIRAMGQPAVDVDALIAERFEHVIRAETDKMMQAKLAEVEAAVRASERARIAGLALRRGPGARGRS